MPADSFATVSAMNILELVIILAFNNEINPRNLRKMLNGKEVSWTSQISDWPTEDTLHFRNMSLSITVIAG